MMGAVSAGGYESWFVSARDPAGPGALWIRHTMLRPVAGPASAALWCTMAGQGGEPVAVKEVFSAFPPEAAAGPGQFRGAATMAGQRARWDLAVAGGPPPLRPLRPAVLYRAPLPRTKLEVSVPDGLVTGLLEVGGQQIGVDRWRGTVGHNWGAEHADRWVWLHAAGFGTEPEAWLDLVLARIKVGPARSPWTAMGALGLAGELIALGGLGRRSTVSAGPGQLTAAVPAVKGRLDLTVSTSDEDAVAVSYADPRGGTRLVRHAARATVQVRFRRPGHEELTLSGTCGAYEYGTSQPVPGTTPRPLPEG